MRGGPPWLGLGSVLEQREVWPERHRERIGGPAGVIERGPGELGAVAQQHA